MVESQRSTLIISLVFSGFVHEVNLDIKYLILADCMVNSIIIAFLIVQVLFVTTSLSSLMFYVAVSCTVLSQIFIISWFANEIEVMSTSISDALFESHWWEQTEKVKRVISIIMMRSRKPLRIMIGPFYPLTIQTALNFPDQICSLPIKVFGLIE
ncbi:hypothetical protein D910_12153, partial [Dendroctonus ponderosae]